MVGMWATIALIFIVFHSLQCFGESVPVSNISDVPKGFGMRFRLPFIDLEIQSVSNLKIIKDDVGEQLFVLHGVELYQLILGTESKRLALIATLGGDVKNTELLGAKVISWREYVLLVIAVEEHLEVYQFAKTTIATRMSNPVNESLLPLETEPIQQLTLHGHFKDMFLSETSEDNISLIVLVNFTRRLSRINTYDWSETYFEHADENTISQVQDIKVIGHRDKYLVISQMSTSQAKLTMVVYAIKTALKDIQTMQFSAVDSIHLFTYQGINYLLSCAPGRKRCHSFKMAGDQFTVYKSRPAAEFYFDQFAAGEHFLVGQRATEVVVYVDPRMECYGTFKTDSLDLTGIMTHVNGQGSEFILLIYVHPYTTLLRVVEIEYECQVATTYEDDEELGAVLRQQKHAFEDVINNLRNILLSRKYPFDEIKKTLASIESKAREVRIPHKVKILAGHIGIVKLVNSKLRSPLQILQRLKDLSNGQRKSRSYRGFRDEQNRTSSLDLKVQNLRVGNLIFDGDLIPGFNLSSDGLSLKIKTPVTTRILQTKELLTVTVMENRQAKQYFKRSVESQINVKSLRVTRINGVPWEEFYQNVFLRSRDRSISGRLIFKSGATIDNLITPTLNGVRTEKLFNLIDEQNVTSDIVISRFFVTDLTVDRLNGLHFARDIARKGVDNFIRSPVIAKNIIVAGKLLSPEINSEARHLFGANFLNFEQTYTGKVVIEGSLTLANLLIEDRKDTRLFVDGKAAPINIATAFWMRSVPQTFEGLVSFTDCQVTAPSLNTLHLNDFPIVDYLLSTGQQRLNPLLLIFLSAHIEGNLFADPKFGSKLRQISQHMFKPGERLVVSGKKTFKEGLTFDHGEVEAFNDLLTSDLVSIDTKACTFTGKKSFQSIYVTKEATVSKKIDVSQLNSTIPMSETHYRFETVLLKSPLTAKHIFFDYLNGLSSEKIFTSMKSFEDKLVLHKDFFVQGNIRFEGHLQADTINNIAWDEYIRSLVRVNENTVIRGAKTFTNTLTISSDLNVPKINEIAIDDLFKNVLLKSQHQDIAGVYTFDNIRLTNIDVPYLNEFHTKEFIDTRSPEVILNSDVIVNKMKIHGSLYGGLEVDFYSLDKRIKEATQKPLKNLHVLGNAYWPWGPDQQSLDLQYLFENAVHHLEDQVITGNVKLKKPLISVMKTKQGFPADIDFDYILNDCLFHNGSTAEVVKAAKVFLKPIRFSKITVLDNLASPIINRVDVLKFNSSLYRVSKPSVIPGPLTFQTPLIFGDLTVHGTVNDVLPNNIFFAYEGTPWPPVALKTLEVEGNLQLLDFDGHNLDYLLKNRIRKSGLPQKIYGHLTFEHLVLGKQVRIRSINGIAIDNVVEKNSPSLQEISGPKTILGDLILAGPAKVMRLNDIGVLERYQKTIFINQDYIFDSLSIDHVKFMNGLISKSTQPPHSLRNHSLDAFYKEAFLYHRDALKEIQHSLRVTEHAIEAKAMNPKKLVYLDYDFSTIIEWKSTNDSIQEQFVFDSKKYQYCDREQTIVSWSKYHNRISLSKTITNKISAEEYGFKVTAENTCKDSYRNTNSRISITEPHFSKRFAISKLVHSIDIYYSGHIFVLLHAKDMYTGVNEIRILKIDSNSKTIQDWQLLTDGVGKVSKLFKLVSRTILVVSTVVENYPSITVYSLNSDTQIFEVIQVIDGDFDIIELAQVTPYIYHLFLSCAHCQRIVIFEYDSMSSTLENCHMYHIYQIIKLQSRIDRFNLFTLPDGGIYLLVLSDQDIDFYHIYKYQFVQGWKHFTYGYFKNIQSAYPLLRDGLSSVDDNLLLLCNRKCTLVKAFYQWG